MVIPASDRFPSSPLVDNASLRLEVKLEKTPIKEKNPETDRSKIIPCFISNVENRVLKLLKRFNVQKL